MPALFALLFVTLLAACAGPPPAEISGELQVSKTVKLEFSGGPEAAETDSDPNPFLDYRLQVAFEGPSDREYSVPGFFDGDGWQVRFTPDQAGEWSYRASFRRGAEVAVSEDPQAGAPVAFDGAAGTLTIAPASPDAPGFAKWGRLEYVGEHYLKFQRGPYWIRGGVDSPENFLAYEGFDATPPSHRYVEHVADWREGDPDWGDGRGRAIIGALNYLASKRVNSLYFLVMNVGGDGRDVYPWIDVPEPAGGESNDNLHFDVSKLEQWETVFAHAQANDIFLHFVFNEAEEANKRELDDGELGLERKLYYREIVARFGHHLALEWNLCEEYNIGGLDLGPERVRAFAGYVDRVDPYDHPITVHSARDPREELAFTFGDERFSLTSVQLNQRRIDTLVEDLRAATAAAGRPLPISMDEFTVANGQRSHMPIDDADRHRREKLWPTYLSGGMIEFILEGLLEVDTFRTPARDALWDYVWYARKFMEQLPFHEMEPADGLASGGGVIRVPGFENRAEPYELGAQIFAKPGEVYAAYLPTAAPSGTLDLSAATGEFELRWYNPRTGEYVGEARTVQGGGRLALGAPPTDSGEDWALVIRRPSSMP